MKIKASYFLVPFCSGWSVALSVMHNHVKLMNEQATKQHPKYSISIMAFSSIDGLNVTI